MAQWSDPRANPIPRAATTSVGEAAFDRGLRSYMLSVYNTMASGVLLTGIVALLFASGGETRSEEHTSELQSLMRISYAVFCLKKTTINILYHICPLRLTLYINRPYTLYSNINSV